MAQVASRLRRRWLLIVVLAVLALIVVFGALSGFYVNILWFREVHQSGVFWTSFWTKLKLGLAFGLLFFVLLFVNLLVVRRLRPQFRVYTPEQEIVERYRAARQTGDYAGMARSLGLHAERVERPDELRAVFARAIAAVRGGQPALVDVITTETHRLSVPDPMAEH